MKIDITDGETIVLLTAIRIARDNFTNFPPNVSETMKIGVLNILDSLKERIEQHPDVITDGMKDGKQSYTSTNNI
jgi:hypothetical protein|tara:strand:+ start:93 stop:317 length:225 start_codon:yes stop_codon:yes gene_type:complete